MKNKIMKKMIIIKLFNKIMIKNTIKIIKMIKYQMIFQLVNKKMNLVLI